MGNGHILLMNPTAALPVAASGANNAADSGYVLHVVPANSGGVDRYVRDICAYRQHDCVVHVAAQQVVMEAVAANRFFPLDAATLQDAALRQITGRPMTLHVHSTLAAVRAMTARLCALLGVGYVLTLHDIDFAGEEADPDERAQRHAFVRNAASRIAPSEFIAGLLRERFGTATPTAVTVIENGVDCQAFAVATDGGWQGCPVVPVVAAMPVVRSNFGRTTR